MLPSSHVSVQSTLSKDNNLHFTPTPEPPLSTRQLRPTTTLLRRRLLKLTLKQGLLIGTLTGLQTTGSTKRRGKNIWKLGTQVDIEGQKNKRKRDDKVDGQNDEG